MLFLARVTIGWSDAVGTKVGEGGAEISEGYDDSAELEAAREGDWK
jgi:hypothetical protein